MTYFNMIFCDQKFKTSWSTHLSYDLSDSKQREIKAARIISDVLLPCEKYRNGINEKLMGK